MSLPYFNLYPTDFEADTSHLNLEEDGAFNRLIRLMWLSPGCSLPDDDNWIARRMRVDMATFLRVVKPIIAEFMQTKAGRIFSPRLMREFKKVDETSRKRSEAGKKGGRPQVSDNTHKEEKPGFDFDKAGLSDTRALPEPEPEPDKKVRGASAPSERTQVIEILCEYAGRDAVESFARYRSKHKSKALTATAAKRLAGELKSIRLAGHDPNDALGMAEERGWSTVTLEYYQNAKGLGKVVGFQSQQPAQTGPAMDGIMRRLAQRRAEHP